MLYVLSGGGRIEGGQVSQIMSKEKNKGINEDLETIKSIPLTGGGGAVDWGWWGNVCQVGRQFYIFLFGWTIQHGLWVSASVSEQRGNNLNKLKFYFPL